MERYKSPLRYPGGKAVLSNFLSKIISDNRIYNCTYVEPFAGGAGAALELLFGEHVWKVVINDADYHISAFWTSALMATEAVLKKIADTPITIQEWHAQKYIFDNPQQHSFIDVGFASFFLNRTNRSGILKGRPIGGFDQTGTWKIDARYNRDALIARIEKLARYRDRISVFCMEGTEFLRNVINPMDGNLLIYLDPPYYKKGSSLYLNYYSSSDHSLLRDFICTELHHNWVLSYDNVQEIKDLYTGLPVRTIKLGYHAYEYREGSELIYVKPTLKIPEIMLSTPNASQNKTKSNMIN